MLNFESCFLHKMKIVGCIMFLCNFKLQNNHINSNIHFKKQMHLLLDYRRGLQQCTNYFHIEFDFENFHSKLVLNIKTNKKTIKHYWYLALEHSKCLTYHEKAHI